MRLLWMALGVMALFGCDPQPDAGDDMGASEASSDAGDDYHDSWWECSPGRTEDCGFGQVRLCVGFNDGAYDHAVWGVCGDCAPGDEQTCETQDGGVQFCNVPGEIVPYEALRWGACVSADEIVCQPGQTDQCPEDGPSRVCILDEFGVPMWNIACKIDTAPMTYR